METAAGIKSYWNSGSEVEYAGHLQVLHADIRNIIKDIINIFPICFLIILSRFIEYSD